jgi:hypothetical protein
MFNAIAANIAVNILACIIYDVAKKVYSIVDIGKNGLRAEIEKYVKCNISNEYATFLESSDFEGFFKLPQISDLINSYIIYVISGSLTKKLKELRSVKNPRQFISENDVLDYLSDSFIEFSSEASAAFNKSELNEVFSHIFQLSNDFFVTEMDLQSKVQLFEVNRKLNKVCNLLIDKLDKCSLSIESALNYRLISHNLDFHKLRARYMDILRKKHNKALIYLLDDFDLDKFYIPPTLTGGGPRSIEFKEMRISRSIPYDSWTNIFTQGNIVYITGGAGYGKSLLMKNIIINYDKLNITEASEHIVIYGEIKWFIKRDGSFRSMTEFLSECITNSTLEQVNTEFINYYLNIGRCVLLLDAIDEVPMDKRKDLHQTIIAHLKNLNPNNKACLTSRDRGFIPVEDEIDHFKIEPLDAYQIEQYVDKIINLGKFNQQDKEPFMQQAKGLVEKRFLSSFLILSLLINIYKGERELPETKLELYQKCLEYIANKRERPKTNDDFDWKLIAPFMKDNTFIELSLLCFPNNKEVKETEVLTKLSNVYRDIFIDTATLENAISEFLKFCSERTELFVPANIENSFKFFHRSFFEYFYSKHTVIRCTNSSEIFNSLVQFDVDSEIFELTLARLKQETQDKYISLVNYVFEKCELDFSTTKPNFRAFNILILFFQVIDEATFQEKFINLITDYSQSIVDNIKMVSNEEIIQNVVVRTNSLDKIINAYEHSAYKEMLHLFNVLDIRVLNYFLDRAKELDEKGTEHQKLFFRQFFLPKSLHFYSLALLSKYHHRTILDNMLNTGVKRKVANELRKRIQYFDSLDEKEKKLYDTFFEATVQWSIKNGLF